MPYNEVYNKGVQCTTSKNLLIMCSHFMARVVSILRTREQIALATLHYLDDCDEDITWGNGDSLDRERVRDYMNTLFGGVQ